MIYLEKSGLAAPTLAPARRKFLSDFRHLTLSATALTLLAGANTGASARTKPSKAAPDADVRTLNVLLALEHEGINAYQLAIGSGLLQKPVQDTATLFQSRHKSHRDTLISVIEMLRGKPAEEKKLDVYAKDLNASALKSQADVLALATRLELGAANTYLGFIPAFKDSHLGLLAGRLAADETMHYTALLQATGQPIPAMALTLGA